MTTTTAIQTKLFNEDSRQIVELPLDIEQVKEIDGIQYDEDMEIYVIEDCVFQELRDNFGDDYRDYEEITREYFIDKCSALEGCHYNYLSDVGYGHVYDLLNDNGGDIAQIISNLPRILIGYSEGSAEYVLYHSDLSSEQVEDINDKVGAAVAFIINNDCMSFYEQYDLDGVTHLLYSMS